MMVSGYEISFGLIRLKWSIERETYDSIHKITI